ncbi:hypothetical protein KORDIASMS9_03752 [Kordia sp. SMS9]|uniref:hypothetical protein n=1 Tax=Kordia sp. SMS9 TaxID=2282170 RepID=UPI000E0DE041|nr:hypothetical protein [Kordia sp. SMS9]AXG71495.1 hypothetical protein KORDIASMS9_03752 [Kordia sp. SMS9]
MKKKSLLLKLKKTKIVNLTTIHHLQGRSAEPLETDTDDPGASCGQYCTVTTTGMTDDKTNTNNSVPTVIGSMLTC